MTSSESFIAVENAFHTGAYERAIEGAMNARANARTGAERVALDDYRARAHVALGNGKVRGTTDDDGRRRTTRGLEWKEYERSTISRTSKGVFGR